MYPLTRPLTRSLSATPSTRCPYRRPINPSIAPSWTLALPTRSLTAASPSLVKVLFAFHHANMDKVREYGVRVVGVLSPSQWLVGPRPPRRLLTSGSGRTQVGEGPPLPRAPPRPLCDTRRAAHVRVCRRVDRLAASFLRLPRQVGCGDRRECARRASPALTRPYLPSPSPPLLLMQRLRQGQQLERRDEPERALHHRRPGRAAGQARPGPL